MQITCTSLQTDNHASTSSLNFYRPGALPDSLPTVCHSIEGQLEFYLFNSAFPRLESHLSYRSIGLCRSGPGPSRAVMLLDRSRHREASAEPVEDSSVQAASDDDDDDDDD